MTEHHRALGVILADMHKIVAPGEYGLGTEPSSIPNDDKAAWVRMGELVEEAQKTLARMNWLTDAVWRLTLDQ